jgi:cation transport regulator
VIDAKIRVFQQYQEEAAFRIAWAAVKREYEKVGDEWVERR